MFSHAKSPINAGSARLKTSLSNQSRRTSVAREVRGNVIQWRRVPDDQTQLTVPVPGEDGAPQTISERAHNLHLIGFVAAAALVFAGRILGIV